MDMMEGARDPGKRRRGAVAVVFLAALPLLVLLFLFGDRAASMAADTQLWSQVKQQSPRNASSRDQLLLDGLLSPEFDEPACRSRYQGSRRWKPSPFPVSPHLVRKLRQYEANHRRCGPGTAPYREAMSQLESGRNGDRGECRYVVWLPIQGLGNRMLSLVSTFLYALLTGRVLLVHEPAEMEALLCEPFPGTSWLLPAPGFPYMDQPTTASVRPAAKKKAVLVVSLKPEYYEKLHGTYYSNATVSGEVVAVFQPSHDGEQQTEARAHNEHALSEMFLLSYCDAMVTTGLSTFRYVTHALAGLRPWQLVLLDQSGRTAEEAVACVRPESVEPCLHSPPSLLCRGGKDVDPVARVPFPAAL